VSLTVAAIQLPSAIFREEQRFGWWNYALIVVIVALTWHFLLDRVPAGIPAAGHHAQVFTAGVVAFMGLTILFAIGVLRMTTVVTPTEVRVWYGWIPTYRRALPVGTITRVEVVQYRPMADHGGHGVRLGRDGERVLTAQGVRGVRLQLLDGSKVLIGSQRPEDLALALEEVRRPGI